MRLIGNGETGYGRLTHRDDAKESGTIKQLNDEKILLDKRLILAGADRATREMLTIFRDDPIEGPLQRHQWVSGQDLPRRILRK